MSADEGNDERLSRIKAQARTDNLRVTQHAHEEMVEEDIALEQVLEAIENAKMLEHYSEHRRGPCCLLSGESATGRPIHIVCTSRQPVLIIITVYEPKPPKWITPTQRGRQP